VINAISVRKFMGGLVTPLLMVAIGTPVPAAADENLGRLFFTPQQRQDLDRRRQANAQETATSANSLVTVNGQVSRSLGKTTTWINGVPQANARKPPDPAQVTLPGGEGEASVTLKIGQTLDKVRGKIRDELGEGRIAVQPAQTRK